MNSIGPQFWGMMNMMYGATREENMVNSLNKGYPLSGTVMLCGFEHSSLHYQDPSFANKNIIS